MCVALNLDSRSTGFGSNNSDNCLNSFDYLKNSQVQQITEDIVVIEAESSDPILEESVLPEKESRSSTVEDETIF